jgi:hypothetical protein
LTIFLTFKAVSAIGGFIMAINMDNSGFVSIGSPQMSPTIFVLSFAFFTGIIYTISREKIKIIYSISNLTMILTVTITTFIVGGGIITLFLH